MNLPATIAILILISINTVVGILLILGKVRLVIVHRQRTQDDAPDFPSLLVVAPIEVPKRKPDRPRKFERKQKTRHLYLRPGVTAHQLGDVAELFQKHQADAGDKVTLHVPANDGPERSIEIPYPVRWSPTVKEDLTTILGGWV